MNDPIDPFEQELRAAMRPVQPPAGFAAGVLARIAAEPSRSRFPRLLTLPPARAGLANRWAAGLVNRWAAGLVAASLLAGVTGSLAFRAHERREANRQFALAMRVTNHALDQTRQQLNRAGIRLAD